MEYRVYWWCRRRQRFISTGFWCKNLYDVNRFRQMYGNYRHVSHKVRRCTAVERRRIVA